MLKIDLLAFRQIRASFRQMAKMALASRDHHRAATDISDAETGAMLRAFFNLTRRWQLDDRQGRALLGWPSARTYP
ncbi:MAG: hypothetical protein J4F33_03090 [Alphaproteobacteria bacterium]|nr:hypothetical protein [Alphaproteobacteria bacterium]